LLLTGCAAGNFDYGTIQNLIEVSPIELDGEQVIINESQLECGSQAELWDVQQLGVGRAIGHLNQGARDLHFSDDIVIGEPGMRSPYAQIRGTFQLRMADFTNVRPDGDNFKLVDVKVGVELANTCFQSPLPLMAVRRGRFTQDVLPTLRVKLVGKDWIFDRFQH
jgi:hypothetical protein